MTTPFLTPSLDTFNDPLSPQDLSVYDFTNWEQDGFFGNFEWQTQPDGGFGPYASSDGIAGHSAANFRPTYSGTDPEAWVRILDGSNGGSLILSVRNDNTGNAYSVTIDLTGGTSEIDSLVSNMASTLTSGSTPPWTNAGDRYSLRAVGSLITVSYLFAGGNPVTDSNDFLSVSDSSVSSPGSIGFASLSLIQINEFGGGDMGGSPPPTSNGSFFYNF